MNDFNMPLWLALLGDDDWWEQLDGVPEGDDPKSWIARAVDEVIAEEEADDEDYSDPYWRRGEWSANDFEPF